MCSCILSPKTSSNKEELSLSVLRNPRSFYYYTGSEITIEDDVYFVNKDGRRSNGVLYDYTYSNNMDYCSHLRLFFSLGYINNKVD